ncbi:MAG: twin-arginine translocase TatA/TatE family subunit [Caldivirga sp.]|jgi:sec-independent protein translocase protein TatA
MIGSIWDWIVVIAVVLILFGGASKIPELFRALGRAVGEFKKGQMEVERELRQMVTEAQSPTPPTQLSPQPTGQTASNTAVNQPANGQPNKNNEVEELRKQVEELKKELERLRSQGQAN